MASKRESKATTTDKSTHSKLAKDLIESIRQMKSGDVRIAFSPVARTREREPYFHLNRGQESAPTKQRPVTETLIGSR